MLNSSTQKVESDLRQAQEAFSAGEKRTDASKQELGRLRRTADTARKETQTAREEVPLSHAAPHQCYKRQEMSTGHGLTMGKHNHQYALLFLDDRCQGAAVHIDGCACPWRARALLNVGIGQASFRSFFCMCWCLSCGP